MRQSKGENEEMGEKEKGRERLVDKCGSFTGKYR